MLERIVLQGYKSIREADITLRPINVLIGANGAGKSNLFLQPPEKLPATIVLDEPELGLHPYAIAFWVTCGRKTCWEAAPRDETGAHLR